MIAQLLSGGLCDVALAEAFVLPLPRNRPDSEAFLFFGRLHLDLDLLRGLVQEDKRIGIHVVPSGYLNRILFIFDRLNRLEGILLPVDPDKSSTSLRHGDAGEGAVRLKLLSDSDGATFIT